MLKNYFISIIRSIKKQKLYVASNILGLTLGIICALIIFMIIAFEISFNSYNKESNKIYRVVTKLNRFGQTSSTAGVPYELPEAMRIDFPELEAVSIVDFNFGKMQVTVTDNKGNRKKFLEKQNTAYVGYDFWKIFTYDWIEGKPSEVISKPNVIVISKSLAEKYFGDKNPIGKEININIKNNYEVAGVVNDPPSNSDFPFQILIPMEKPRRSSGWGSVSMGVQCFIKVPQKINAASIESRMDGFLKKHMGPEDYRGIVMKLQPLSDVHLDDRYGNLTNSIFTKDKIIILAVIGLMLLIVSCINFVNLKTALASGHFKEIAIRKVMGSNRFQIAGRFFGETLLLTFFSSVLAFILAGMVLPRLAFFTGYSLSFSQVGYEKIIVFLFATTFITGIMSGLYPSLFNSKLQPERALKSNTAGFGKNISLRKVLIVLQFVVSEALIIGTLVVYNQLDYLNYAKMGFDKSSVLEVGLPNSNVDKVDRFKNLLRQFAAVENVSFSNTGAASENMWYGDSKVYNANKPEEFRSQIKFVDSDFLKTYKIRLLAGRMLRDDKADTNYIVNEAFVKRMGLSKDYQAAIGHEAEIWGMPGTIVGVFSDFNTQSLENEISPLIMNSARNLFNVAAIRIRTAGLHNPVENVKAMFEKVYPDYVFDYHFLDKTIENFYVSENRFSRLMITFSFIAVLIGCMGIFGLSAFMAFSRNKEIGVRKVLGASSGSIVSLLSKDFVKLVITANVIAWPVAYYFMNKWLQDFAYRIDIGWWVFVLSGGIALVIVLATVSFQAIKAATANPIESLRYE